MTTKSNGADTRVAPDATVFPHRTARFLLKQSVVVAPDADRPARDPDSGG